MCGNFNNNTMDPYAGTEAEGQKKHRCLCTSMNLGADA